MTAVFPIYFVKVAGAGLRRERRHPAAGDVNTLALVIIALALTHPRRDLRLQRGQEAVHRRRSWCSASAATAALCTVHTGDLELASWLFIAGAGGRGGSFVFYESLLPHIAAPDEMDRVSTAGYALGYVGGGLLLALNLAWIQKPEWFGLPSGPDSRRPRPPCRPGSPSCRWRSGGSSSRIPLFRRVPEPPARIETGRAPGREPGPGGVRAAGRDVPRAARLPAGVPDAAGVPDLQRRHPDHHQDGHRLRHRDRHRRRAR